MPSVEMTYTLQALAERAGVACRGAGTRRITGLATLKSAGPEQLTFLANPAYAALLATTQAGAVILHPRDADRFAGDALISPNPYATFAQLTACFRTAPEAPAGRHATAVVAESAVVPASCHLGPQVVIGEGVVLGERCVIQAGTVIESGVRLGDDCQISPRVVIHHDCVLGDRVRLASGVVIGADGFGFAPQNGQWLKVHQLGAVRIGHDVDVGANTTIDRGALDDTEIHDHVIIDNQVQIAHNVIIGEGTAIAACCGISGSTRIGRHCILAGGVGLVGHIELCDRVHITGMTMVTKSITEPGSYSSGTAFDRSDRWKKMAARLRRLDELNQRVRRLEQGTGDPLS